MSYADGLLSTGERIAHREKQHWFVFIWGAKWAVIALIVAILLFILRETPPVQDQAEGIRAGDAEGIGPEPVFGRIFVFGYLEIFTAADTGVDRFHMIRNPIGFKKAMLDAKHEYERDVAGGSYAPSPPLRTEPLANPPVAASVKSAPGDDTVSGDTPGRPPTSAISSDELTRTLSSLADLRDRGAITAEEYERKKADLLSRL